MKIAYLAHWAEQPNSGVIAKIRAQTTCWRLDGHQVSIFLIVPAENRAAIEKEFQFDGAVRTFPYNSKIDQFATTSAATAAVASWKPDIAYCRQMTYHPAFTRLAMKIPTVIEVNTNDVRELELGSALGRWYGKITRRFRYAFSCGLVCVTQELADAHEFTSLKKPSIVVANGIQLDAKKPLPPANNDMPHLVFLGSGGQVWHGIDKIVRLAKEFPDWTFHLVGPKFADLGAEPSDNIVLYGHLDEPAYIDIMTKSDVAIGTLALHRKGMDEACPLKVREYLAAGLPTIVGYNDTDFPDEVPYILRLPNVDDNTDSGRIADFVDRWKNRRVNRKDISHLDISAKETSRLQFFRSIIAER